MEVDNEDEDAFLQAVVAHHNTTLNVVCDAWFLQEQQNQQVIAVLALCEHFRVALLPHLLSLEVLLIFYDLLLLTGHNWRGSQMGKAPNFERGREAAMGQLVADYFAGDKSIFLDAQFCWRFRM